MTSQKIKLLLILCFLLLLGALSWLGVSLLKNEQIRLQESHLIQKMEQERLALWRLDSFLATLWQQADTLTPSEFENTFLSPSPTLSPKEKEILARFSPLMGAAFQFCPEEEENKPATFVLHPTNKSAPSLDSALPPRFQPLSAHTNPPATLDTPLQKKLLLALSSTSSFSSLRSPSPAPSLPALSSSENREEELSQEPLQKEIPAFSVQKREQQEPLSEAFLSASSPTQKLSQVDLSYKQNAEDLALRQNFQNKAPTPLQDDFILSQEKEISRSSKKSSAPTPSAKLPSKKTSPSLAKTQLKEKKAHQKTDASFTAEVTEVALLDALSDNLTPLPPKADLRASLEKEALRVQEDIEAFTLNELGRYEPNERLTKESSSLGKIALEKSPTLAPSASAWVSPFKAYQIEGELYLVRSLHTKEDIYIQGLLLKNESLATHLYSLIKESLPEARFKEESLPTSSLHPSTQALALLPWTLHSGLGTLPSSYAFSSLPLSLLGAWLCLLLALAGLSLLIYKLWELQERKSLFVSAVTHELRTPLTTFHLYSDLLEARLVPAQKVPHYFAILKKESQRLIHLVDNVLSYSKLEKSFSKPTLETLSVEDLAQRLRSLLDPLFFTANMDLVLLLEDNLAQKTLKTDPSILEQVFYNLADNALKYAHKEDSLITLSFQEEEGKLCLFFTDQGKGIDPAFQKKLFKPFCRSAEEAAGKKPGVGLGLALCQKLCRPLGAELSLWQSSSEGTTFRLCLPLDS